MIQNKGEKGWNDKLFLKKCSPEGQTPGNLYLWWGMEMLLPENPAWEVKRNPSFPGHSKGYDWHYIPEPHSSQQREPVQGDSGSATQAIWDFGQKFCRAPVKLNKGTQRSLGFLNFFYIFSENVTKKSAWQLQTHSSWFVG